MRTEDIIGVSGLGLAVVLSMTVYGLYRNNNSHKLAFHLALMTFGVVLVFTALVPQILTINDLGTNYLDSWNPFLLALFPVSIAAKMPGERDVIRSLSGIERSIVVVQISGLLSIQAIYIVFIYQYAAAAGSRRRVHKRGGFYALATLYVFGFAGLVIYIFDIPGPTRFGQLFASLCFSPVDKTVAYTSSAPQSQSQSAPSAPAASSAPQFSSIF